MKERYESINMLLTAQGQLAAVLRMMDEDRYCIDVSNQILAVTSLLRKANTLLLQDHMNTCVKDAISRGEGDKYVDELSRIFEKISK